MPDNIHLYAEGLAFLMALLYWGKLRNTKMRSLPYYLGLILIVEVVSYYLRTKKVQVGLIYNFTIPIEILYFSYLFYLHFASEKWRWFVRIFGAGFVLFWIFFTATTTEEGFHPIFLKIENTWLLILSCLYFIYLLQLDIPVNFLHHSMFWICCGLFFFNAGEVVLSMVMDRLAPNIKEWRSLHNLINKNLNILLYLLISIAIGVEAWNQKRKP